MERFKNNREKRRENKEKLEMGQKIERHGRGNKEERGKN